MVGLEVFLYVFSANRPVFVYTLADNLVGDKHPTGLADFRRFHAANRFKLDILSGSMVGHKRYNENIQKALAVFEEVSTGK